MLEHFPNHLNRDPREALPGSAQRALPGPWEALGSARHETGAIPQRNAESSASGTVGSAGKRSQNLPHRTEHFPPLPGHLCPEAEVLVRAGGESTRMHPGDCGRHPGPASLTTHDRPPGGAGDAVE